MERAGNAMWDSGSDSLDVFGSCPFNWRHFTVYHKLKREDETNLLMKRALLLHAKRKSKATNSDRLTFSASTAPLIKFPKLFAFSAFSERHIGCWNTLLLVYSHILYTGGWKHMQYKYIYEKELYY